MNVHIVLAWSSPDYSTIDGVFADLRKAEESIPNDKDKGGLRYTIETFEVES